MEKRPLPQKGRPKKLGEVKALIAALAITGTLAFWNLFSKPADIGVSTAAAEAEIALTTDIPVTELELPPLPTLIPPLPESALVIPMDQTSSQSISQPVVQTTGKILLGSAQPGTTQPQRTKNQKPAARTRSSN